MPNDYLYRDLFAPNQPFDHDPFLKVTQPFLSHHASKANVFVIPAPQHYTNQCKSLRTKDLRSPSISLKAEQ